MKKKESNNSKSSIPSVTEVVSGMNAVAPRSNKNNRGVSYESIATEYLLKTINELVNAKEKDGLKEKWERDCEVWDGILRATHPECEKATAKMKPICR